MDDDVEQEQTRSPIWEKKPIVARATVTRSGGTRRGGNLQRVIPAKDIWARLVRQALCVAAVVLGPGLSTAQDVRPADLSAKSAQACALGGCEVRPGDEVWAINCRGINVIAPEVTLAGLRYERYLPGQGWLPWQAADFLRPPAGMPTVFFVVGNYYTHQETVETGWFAYHRLVESCAGGLPVRFVMWSWPSDPIPGRRLRDAKIKLGRIDATSYHLAALADALPPTGPISMCGSSFGVGIVLGAAQLVSAGRLGCYELLPRSGAQHCLRLVLLGAAVDDDVFLRGQKYDAVLPSADRVLLMVNPRDRALKRYHKLFGRHSGAEALGSVGPAGGASLPGAGKLGLVPSGRYLGHQHGMLAHWRSAPIVARMRPYLLGGSGRPTSILNRDFDKSDPGGFAD